MIFIYEKGVTVSGKDGGNVFPNFTGRRMVWKPRTLRYIREACSFFSTPEEEFPLLF